MRIKADNEVVIRLSTFDFDFLMVATAVFTSEEVELEECSYKTLDGYTFSVLDDGDEDNALEQWIDETLEMLSHQMHQDWSLESEKAGYEVEYPAHWLNF